MQQAERMTSIDQMLSPKFSTWYKVKHWQKAMDEENGCILPDQITIVGDEMGDIWHFFDGKSMCQIAFTCNKGKGNEETFNLLEYSIAIGYDDQEDHVLAKMETVQLHIKDDGEFVSQQLDRVLQRSLNNLILEMQDHGVQECYLKPAIQLAILRTMLSELDYMKNTKYGISKGLLDMIRKKPLEYLTRFNFAVPADEKKYYGNFWTKLLNEKNAVAESVTTHVLQLNADNEQACGFSFGNRVEINEYLQSHQKKNEKPARQPKMKHPATVLSSSPPLVQQQQPAISLSSPTKATSSLSKEISVSKPTTKTPNWIKPDSPPKLQKTARRKPGRVAQIKGIKSIQKDGNGKIEYHLIVGTGHKTVIFTDENLPMVYRQFIEKSQNANDGLEEKTDEKKANPEIKDISELSSPLPPPRLMSLILSSIAVTTKEMLASIEIITKKEAQLNQKRKVLEDKHMAERKAKRPAFHDVVKQAQS